MMGSLRHVHPTRSSFVIRVRHCAELNGGGRGLRQTGNGQDVMRPFGPRHGSCSDKTLNQDVHTFPTENILQTYKIHQAARLAHPS